MQVLEGCFICLLRLFIITPFLLSINKEGSVRWGKVVWGSDAWTCGGGKVGDSFGRGNGAFARLGCNVLMNRLTETVEYIYYSEFVLCGTTCGASIIDSAIPMKLFLKP